MYVWIQKVLKNAELIRILTWMVGAEHVDHANNITSRKYRKCTMKFRGNQRESTQRLQNVEIV